MQTPHLTTFLSKVVKVCFSFLIIAAIFNSCKKDEAAATASTPAKYNVTFDLNGGTGTAPASQTVESNGKATDPISTSLTKTNYIFSGWGANANSVSKIDIATTPIVANTTLVVYKKVCL